jgi:hypothetical protein
MRSFSHYHLRKLILVGAVCAAVGGAFVGYLGIGLIILGADRLVARWEGWLSRRSALPATAIPSVAPVEDDR